MKPNVDTLSFLIGFIAGTIYYIDGWAPSTGKDFKKNRRYRGLAVIIGGGILTPLLDSWIIESEKYDFFLGYLFGTTIGWLSLLILGLILYVFWKNTKDNQANKKLHAIGQVAYSILEFIYLGIAENPHLNRERTQQLEVDTVIGNAKIDDLKEKLKKEDPTKYLNFAEKEIEQDKADIESRLKKLDELKKSITHSEESPVEEAEKTIEFQNRVISTLQEELKLVENNKRDNPQSELQNALNFYKERLWKEENERKDLEKALNKFRNKKISKEDFLRIIQYQRINQFEHGGVLLGKTSIRNIEIKFYQGDITNLTSDVIVSSDDNYLTMGGGVSMAIRRTGGNSIYKEAQLRAPIDFGSVISTNAGNLHAKSVYHAAVIDHDNGVKPNAEVIAKVVEVSLKKTQNCICQVIRGQFSLKVIGVIPLIP